MLRQGVDLANAVAAHLQEVTGQPARLEPCPHTPLPAYLAHGFDLACGDVLGVACVFATPLRDTTRAPAALEKRLARLAEAFGRPAVLVLDDLPARDRQRLMARRVPFIVPFVHAYLPPALIDSRAAARPRGVPQNAPETLAPATQLLLLHALLTKDAGDLYAQDLVRALGVSAMTVSRAFKELDAADLITRPRAGRPRPARLTHPKRETWQRAQPLLRSPVRARYLTATSHIPGALEAGLSALGRLSDLAPPREPTVALAQEAWREHEAELQPEPYSYGALEPHHTLVEVWCYDPRVLTQAPHVDVLSLCLSLRETHDERVEAALEQALAALAW
jgi:DNA-binding MarR family transcriptional regulator